MTVTTTRRSRSEHGPGKHLCDLMMHSGVVTRVRLIDTRNSRDVLRLAM